MVICHVAAQSSQLNGDRHDSMKSQTKALVLYGILRSETRAVILRAGEPRAHFDFR